MSNNTFNIIDKRNSKWKELMKVKLYRVLHSFDFMKVALVMKTVGWTYGGVMGDIIVPDIPHLQETAKKLLIYVIGYSISHNGDEYTSSTGGFKAVCDAKNSFLSLEFILEEQYSTYEDEDEEDDEDDFITGEDT